MAKIQEEVIVIKFSKLVKDSDGSPSFVTEETINALEQVAQELVGDSIIAEVEQVK
jgi:hypothetical protein